MATPLDCLLLHGQHLRHPLLTLNRVSSSSPAPSACWESFYGDHLEPASLFVFGNRYWHFSVLHNPSHSWPSTPALPTGLTWDVLQGRSKDTDCTWEVEAGSRLGWRDKGLDNAGLRIYSSQSSQSATGRAREAIRVIRGHKECWS